MFLFRSRTYIDAYSIFLKRKMIVSEKFIRIIRCKVWQVCQKEKIVTYLRYTIGIDTSHISTILQPKNKIRVKIVGEIVLS